MFFNNSTILLFLNFLWLGLIFGFVHILFKLVVQVSRKNVYVTNFVGFCFWLAFGMCFSVVSIARYNYSVCWFGLFGMFLGFFLVKISADFFFTKIILLLYNKHTKRKMGKSSGKLQAS